MANHEFINYVKSFYSKTCDGIYADEYNWSDEVIEAACIIRQNMGEAYAGDTVDREWVRDLLINNFGTGV